MLDDSTINHLADELCATGATHFTDERGHRLVVMASGVVGVPGGDFILAYENTGTIFFNTSRPMNEFRLTAAGFSLRIAPLIADTINRLFAAVTQRVGATVEYQEGLVPIGESK